MFSIRDTVVSLFSWEKLNHLSSDLLPDGTHHHCLQVAVFHKDREYIATRAGENQESYYKIKWRVFTPCGPHVFPLPFKEI